MRSAIRGFLSPIEPEFRAYGEGREIADNYGPRV
jgi:hypothetical protein